MSSDIIASSRSKKQSNGQKVARAAVLCHVVRQHPLGIPVHRLSDAAAAAHQSADLSQMRRAAILLLGDVSHREF